jgi:hypothetical protein
MQIQIQPDLLSVLLYLITERKVTHIASIVAALVLAFRFIFGGGPSREPRNDASAPPLATAARTQTQLEATRDPRAPGGSDGSTGSAGIAGSGAPIEPGSQAAS